MRKTALAAAVLMLMGGSATAGGWYVGGGAGISQLDPDPNGLPGEVTDKNDTAIRGFIGKDLSKRISVEAYYANLGSAKVAEDKKGGKIDGEIAYQVAGVQGLYRFYNSKGFHRGKGGVSLFGKAGVGVMYNEATNVHYERENDYHFAVGAGAEYAFNNRFGARLDVDLYDRDAIAATVSGVARLGGAARSVVSLPKPMKVRDSDGDGVPDTVDQCDTVPGPADNFGCPVQHPAPPPPPPPAPPPVYEPPPPVYEPPPQYPFNPQPVDVYCEDPCPYVQEAPPYQEEYHPPPAMGPELLGRIFFALDSHELDATARQALQRLAEYLRQNPHAHVTLAGHTCAAASELHNDHLSRRRAESVKQYLLSLGIPASRLRTEHYGETRPAESNATPEGRQLNRRVEIYVSQ